MHWSLATVALLPRGESAHANQAERRRVLKWAASAGFEGVEISPQWLDIDRLPAGELEHFRDEAAVLGLAVSGVNVNRCLFVRHPGAVQELARIRRAIEAAAVLQAPIVTLSLSRPLPLDNGPTVSGDDFSDEQRSYSAARLAELASDAACRGIELSLELHDDGLLDTASHCLDMLRRVAAANVGVNPDLGNFVRSSPAIDTWEAELCRLAPHANNWHVKNYRAQKPAPLWDGDIDYARALNFMRDAGYQGWVSIESYAADPFSLQEQGLHYLRGLLSECAAASSLGKCAS